MKDVEVLRLGHRPGRDDRLTTHVGLTARAFGASKVHFAGERDSGPLETVGDVVERFGGEFTARHEPSPRAFVRDWPGEVVHLTMYGLPVEDSVGEVERDSPVLVVVGSRKVDGWTYDEADHNVAVTSQPHSEVAALAVYLHLHHDGEELGLEFPGGEVDVVPSVSGKETRTPES
ncbi:MAG: tRNA (cytidine(56)-2'-O)-methyltransferase [Halobacteriales archaeon]